MNIIELAKEAGIPCFAGMYVVTEPEELERFAALVQFASANARAEREWVDLTDDEIAQEFCFDDYDYARAVIAAFKEKNK